MIKPTPRSLELDYTNHRGVRKLYQIEPIEWLFTRTDYHTQYQWILRAIVLEHGGERGFAVDDIHSTKSILPKSEEHYWNNPNVLVCPLCNYPQFETPSGMTCANGHAGVTPL